MPNSGEGTEEPEALPKVIHDAAMEAEMEDRWDDGLLRGIKEGIRRRDARKALEARQADTGNSSPTSAEAGQESQPDTTKSSTTTKRISRIRDTTGEKLGQNIAIIGGVRSPEEDSK